MYYLAIAVTLTLPDICAGLECDPDGVWVTDKKYKDWCEKYLSDAVPQLVADDYYHLRGGVLHNGKFGHPKSRFDRVVFVSPQSRFQMHGTIMKVGDDVMIGGKSAKELRMAGDILGLNVQTFCEVIIERATVWWQEKHKDANVLANLPTLVRYRPPEESLPPFFVGVPIVA